MRYILECLPHNLIGMVCDPFESMLSIFTKGKPWGDFESPVTIKLEQNHPLPDYFELDGVPIVSQKFVDAWHQLPIENYQFFPTLIEVAEKTIKNYSILNIVGLCNCIDKERSELNLYKTKVMRINNLILDTDECQEDVARLQGYPLAIIISEKVRDSLLSSSLTGVMFEPAIGWNDRHRF